MTQMARPAVQAIAARDVECDVELVLAFLNTATVLSTGDFEGSTDLLDDPVAWPRWARQRELGPPGDPTAARDVRDAMRSALTSDGPLFPRDGPDWPVRVELHQGIPVLTAPDALGNVLAAALRLATTGHWERLKICPAGDCRWAFYDRSRNRSRTWCSMRICGNREKARTWRERHTAE